MLYDSNLIRIDSYLYSDNEMYSVILLSARKLTFMLNGVRCFLSGKYMLCLSVDDTVEKISGDYVAHSIRYLPCFINANLSHEIIGQPLYESMRAAHQYPDFHLFYTRDDIFFGILALTESEYDTACLYFERAKSHLSKHETDTMWSCYTRSDLFSLLNVAESAYCGKESGEGNDIVCYIKENAGNNLTLSSISSHFHMSRTTLSGIVRKLTGMPPMAYVLEERLTQVLPDLLFTKVPINILSERYGFSDMNYFIRAFKKKYGKPPLQYRNDGYAERLKNEKSYHRKELDLMFTGYLKRGRGRAFTLLSEQTDKTPYRRLLIDFITNTTQHYRVLGAYEKKLIDCFDDRQTLSAEIAGILLSQISVGKNTVSIPLLTELGYAEEARHRIEQLYTESYFELAEFTKHGSSEEKYPPCACRYFAAVASLGRYLKVDRERMKKALFDMADLFCYSDKPVVPCYQNPLFLVMDGMKRDEFYFLLDEVIAEHKNGAKLDIRQELEQMSKPVPDPGIVAEDIVNSTIDDFDRLFVSFASAPEREKLNVAYELLKTQDVERRLYLMLFFMEGYPGIEPPAFPLDPTPIINIADESLQIFREAAASNSVTETKEYRYLSFLSHIRHAAVRAYAKKLMKKAENDEILMQFALKMLWGANYIPEDRAEFADFLKKYPVLRPTMIDIFIANIRKKTPDFLLELCPFVFAEADPRQREELVKALAANGELPESIRKECRFDAEKRIRKIAEE